MIIYPTSMFSSLRKQKFGHMMQLTQKSLHQRVGLDDAAVLPLLDLGRWEVVEPVLCSSISGDAVWVVVGVLGLPQGEHDPGTTQTENAEETH